MHAIVLLLAAVTVTPSNESAQDAAKPKPLPPGVIQVQVGTMHCPSCAKQIARNLYKTPGVMRVKTDMKRNRVWITLQPKKRVDLARVWAATKLKDVQPETLRVADRVLTAEDFEEKLGQKPPAAVPTRR